MAEWVQRPSLNHPRSGLDGATVDQRILAIGGFDRRDQPNFDFVEARRVGGPGTWQDLQPLPTRRGNLAVAELDGFVYAAGGIGSDANGDDILVDVVERFDPDDNSWSPSPSLPQGRGGAAAAGLDHVLYVAGGEAADEDGLTVSLLAYRPEDGVWETRSPMPLPKRQRHRLVAAAPYLYALGGMDENLMPLSNVERYDPVSDTWQTIAPMRETRLLPGVVAFRRGNDRYLVVVGGTSGPQGARVMRRTTEIYNIDTGRWHVIAPHLPRGAVSLFCATEADGDVLAIGGGTDNGVVGSDPSSTGEVLALRLTNQDLHGE